MRRSIITGDIVPHNETWVWNKHQNIGYGNPDKGERKSCNRCHKEPADLFDYELLLCHGHVTICYDCIKKANNAMWSDKNLCPVCGFGVYSFGGEGSECIWGHQWVMTDKKIGPNQTIKMPVIKKG